MLELPQRDIGGQLPTWDDLRSRRSAGRASAGAAAHLDGARLWECGPFYGRPRGGDRGAVRHGLRLVLQEDRRAQRLLLAGAEDVTAEAREWRRRHGGTLFALWPYAASDLAGLRTRLPRMPSYHEHALAIGAALRDVAGVQVLPDPPQTSMMHLLLRTDADRMREAALRLARDEGIWTWSRSWPSRPGTAEVEFDVGDATLGFTPEEAARAVASLLG